MYGMHKTTVYLTDDLKRAVERKAEAERLSEAEVVRRAVGSYAGLVAPRPRLPLFDDPGDPFSAADYVEEALHEGFGQS